MKSQCQGGLVLGLDTEQTSLGHLEHLVGLRRSVKMKHLVTPPTPSAPSGPRKSAPYPRSQSRSSLPSQVVPRSQGRFVLQLVVGLRKVPRSVMTRSKLLSKMPLRNSVLLSPSVPASM